jgi:enoyl-CoA hydratase/carnithine racemase
MRDYSRFDCFKVQRDDKVAILTINQPESHNAFGPKLHKQTEEIFLEVAHDDDVQAIVFTAAGKYFSVGGDIKTMQMEGLSNRIPPEEPIRLILNLLRINQPIIAALNGNAIGVAATLALFCDIVVASEKALIGDPHVNVGLVAGDGGCVIWPLLVGINRAKEMLLTGKLINAQEAERIGLINHCVPPESVLPKALEIARSLANGPTKAIQWTKMSLNQRLIEDVNSMLPASTAFEFLSMNMEDHREATRAFIEKRKPRFTGK